MIAGDAFALWTVLSVVPGSHDRDRSLICRCACGTVQRVREFNARHGRSIGCRSCVARRSAARVSPWLRVLRRCSRRGSCWVFAGTLRDGYGVVAVGHATTVLAHRIAWMATRGSIPDGLLVLHRCDNPPCCNPAHLFLGSNQDNMDDMVAKGRHRNGATARSAAQ